MTQILIDSGQPYNWGSNTSVNAANLQDFGLAKYGETTREAYVLDPDNVLRLDPNNPFYIPPSEAAVLLNLAQDFGFTLDINPILNVTVSNTSNNNVYSVMTSSEYEASPVANAQVNATLFYLNSATQTINSKSISVLTGYDGRCTLDFTAVPNTQMKVLALSMDYYGIRTAQTYTFGSSVVPAYLIGNSLYLNSASTIKNSNITQVIATQEPGGYMISAFNSQLVSNTAQNFTLAFTEPTAVAILGVLSDGQTLICASRNISVSYSTIPGITSFPLSYSLERTVIIAGTTYAARLLLWRMSY